MTWRVKNALHLVRLLRCAFRGCTVRLERDFVSCTHRLGAHLPLRLTIRENVRLPWR